MSSARALTPHQIGKKFETLCSEFQNKGKDDADTQEIAEKTIRLLSANVFQWTEAERRAFRAEYGIKIQANFPEKSASRVASLVSGQPLAAKRQRGIKWPGYFFFQLHPENRTWALLEPCIERMYQPGFNPEEFLKPFGEMLSAEETPKYKRALKYLERAMVGKNGDLSTFSQKNLMKLIRVINEAVVPGGGAFKTTDTLILNSEEKSAVIHPSHRDVPSLMDSFVQSLIEKLKTEEDPYWLMSFVHQGLIQIHPFADGNGRLARILMNLVGYQRGLYPILIDCPENYQRALQDLESFANYLRNLHEKQSKIYSDPIFTTVIDRLLAAKAELF